MLDCEQHASRTKARLNTAAAVSITFNRSFEMKKSNLLIRPSLKMGWDFGSNSGLVQTINNDLCLQSFRQQIHCFKPIQIFNYANSCASRLCQNRARGWECKLMREYIFWHDTLTSVYDPTCHALWGIVAVSKWGEFILYYVVSSVGAWRDSRRWVFWENSSCFTCSFTQVDLNS